MLDTLNNIEKNNFPHTILIFGEESFLIEEAVGKAVTTTLPNEMAEYNFDSVDCNEIDIMTLTDKCQAYPFMSENRVVLAKHLDKLFTGRKSKKSEKEAAGFLKYLKSPEKSTYLIMTADLPKLKGLARLYSNNAKRSEAEKKIDAAKYPFNEIIQLAEWIEFPKLWDDKIPEWIISRFRMAGKNTNIEAASNLMAQTGNSLFNLKNEIEKILMYVQDRDIVNVEDIKFVAGASREFNAFDLRNAIGKKDLAEALKILESLMITIDSEMIIISVLYNYFLTLFKLPEAMATIQNQYQLARAVGVPYFFLKDFTSVLRNYSPGEIENALIAIEEAENKFKTTNPSVVLIFQEMILKIIEGK